jgi:hypothetical protein
MFSNCWTRANFLVSTTLLHVTKTSNLHNNFFTCRVVFVLGACMLVVVSSSSLPESKKFYFVVFEDGA